MEPDIDLRLIVGKNNAKNHTILNLSNKSIVRIKSNFSESIRNAEEIDLSINQIIEIYILFLLL